MLGDGAGVGKGRQIAASIVNLWVRGVRRHVWCSCSKDPHDARRDLAEIGAGHIPVRPLDGFEYGGSLAKLGKFKEGVLFARTRG